MMRRKLLAAPVLLAVAVGATPALAADHVDGPASFADPAADITDVYAWMSGDASKVYLVMSLWTNAMKTQKFSDKVKYVLHLSSRPAYGAAPADRVKIICTFDAGTPQKGSCWLTDKDGKATDYVTGDLSDTKGVTSMNGKMKVFAGPRDDAFFFNIDGWKAMRSLVLMSKGALAPTFDPAGCPKGVDANTSSLIVATLKSDGKNGPAKDNFGGYNTTSIVVAVDKAAVAAGGAILGVWGSTNK